MTGVFVNFENYFSQIGPLKTNAFQSIKNKRKILFRLNLIQQNVNNNSNKNEKNNNNNSM